MINTLRGRSEPLEFGIIIVIYLYFFFVALLFNFWDGKWGDIFETHARPFVIFQLLYLFFGELRRPLGMNARLRIATARLEQL